LYDAGTDNENEGRCHHATARGFVHSVCVKCATSRMKQEYHIMVIQIPHLI